MQGRPEVMAFRLTPREGKIIRRLAAKRKMTESQFVRAAVLNSCVMEGDVEAMRLLGGYLVKDFAEKVSRLMLDGELNLERV